MHIGQITAFDKGCLLLMHLFLVISVNIAINHILLKTGFFGLRFCHRQYRVHLVATSFTQLAFRCDAFSEQ